MTMLRIIGAIAAHVAHCKDVGATSRGFQGYHWIAEERTMYKRLVIAAVVVALAANASALFAQCGCGAAVSYAPTYTSYYAPTATYYYAPTPEVTYYAPTTPYVSYYAPYTTYYAAPTYTSYYAPYTSYYTPYTTYYVSAPRWRW